MYCMKISDWPLLYFFNIHRRTDSLPKSLGVSDEHLLFICDALVEVNHIFLTFKKLFNIFKKKKKKKKNSNDKEVVVAYQKLWWLKRLLLYSIHIYFTNKHPWVGNFIENKIHESHIKTI